ncbi:MAG: hypothetical protein M3P51_16160 [Chloroflexota bacterium]|nr:hypothetical protein [Chloroflexota bacterium]
MNENQQNSRNHDEPWKERVVYRSPAIVAVLLWAFTALYFRPGIDFLLLFAIGLAGVGLITEMLLRWGGGRLSSRYTLAACLTGVLMVAYAGVELARLPEGAPAPVRLLLLLFWFVGINYLRRVWAQEKGAQPYAP